MRVQIEVEEHGLDNDGRLLDRYEPASLLFTSSLGGAGTAPIATSRPLLIYVHGGGYTQGTRANGEAAFVCEQFASRGWRAVSIEYRMSSVLLWSQSIIMGVEDTRAALRWARANAATYLFDANKIVVAGSSAGGGALDLQRARQLELGVRQRVVVGRGESDRAERHPRVLARLPGGLQPRQEHAQRERRARTVRQELRHARDLGRGGAHRGLVRLRRSNSPTNALALQQLYNGPRECWEPWPSPNIKNENSGFYEDAAAAIPKCVGYFKAQLGL